MDPLTHAVCLFGEALILAATLRAAARVRRSARAARASELAAYGHAVRAEAAVPPDVIPFPGPAAARLGLAPDDLPEPVVVKFPPRPSRPRLYNPGKNA